MNARGEGNCNKIYLVSNMTSFDAKNQENYNRAYLGSSEIGHRNGNKTKYAENGDNSTFNEGKTINRTTMKRIISR